LKGLREADVKIVKYVKKDISPLDPAQPTPWEQWYWPLSPLVASIKPDGN